jgi:hypothetical protein
MSMNSSAPVTVSGLTDVTQLAVGARGACAVASTGALSCWGASPLLTSATNTPTAVASETSVAKVDADDVVCILRLDGTYECFGEIGASGGP